MELLESFQFNLDDQFLGGSGKKISGYTDMYSVNSAYTTDKWGKVSKTSKAGDYQDRLRNIILYSRKNKGIYKFPVFLNIEVHKIISKKKDGGDDQRGFVDIDNVLKGNIDCLNKTVIEDDNQVMGILVKLFYNRDKNSYIRIKIFRYNEESFDRFKLDWKNKNIMNLAYENAIVLPAKMHLISYNEMYDRAYKTTKLTKLAKQYKEYLEKSHSEKIHGKDPIEDFLIGDYTFYFCHGDLDNKVKAFQDSMSKIVMKDDKQLQTLFLQKKFIKENIREGVQVSLYRKTD